MTHPALRLVRARLDHADAHIAAFKARTQELVSKGAVEGLWSHDPDLSAIEFRIQGVEGPPEVALIAGDALQALRSALNNVVILMLERVGAPVLKKHQFPIETSSNAKARRSLLSQVEGISPLDLKLVSKYQPSTWALSERLFHPLARLQDLSNWDKHQQLLLPAVSRSLMRRGAFGTWKRVANLTELAPDAQWELWAPFPHLDGASIKPFVTHYWWGEIGDPVIFRIQMAGLPPNSKFTYQGMPLGFGVSSDTTAVDDAGLDEIRDTVRRLVAEVDAAWTQADALSQI